MDLCDIGAVRDLLRRHKFDFRKSLGQNFLIAPWVPERIARESGVNEENCVLEIGPGVGCLTRELAARSGRVVSVELDRRLLPVLEETLADLPNVQVVPGDILKLDLSALAAEHFGGLRPVVCANLPYNITSPVLTRLIQSRLFGALTVMVQREVAQRMAAGPGSKDYGAFSLFCRFYTEPMVLFDVPPNCFEPAPKVTSAVVRMAVREAPAAAVDEVLFFRTVRAAFNQRRKTLPNALSAGFPELSKAALSEAILACGLSESVRGEALDLAAFAALTGKLSEALT